MSPTQQIRAAINKTTTVSLGLVLAVTASVIAPMIGLMIVADRRMTRLEDAFESRMLAMEVIFEQWTRDRYTMDDASRDAASEALANPGHAVPDPRRPGQFFHSESGVDRGRWNRD